MTRQRTDKSQKVNKYCKRSNGGTQPEPFSSLVRSAQSQDGATTDKLKVLWHDGVLTLWKTREVALVNANAAINQWILNTLYLQK